MSEFIINVFSVSAVSLSTVSLLSIMSLLFSSTFKELVCLFSCEKLMTHTLGMLFFDGYAGHHLGVVQYSHTVIIQ